MAMFTSLAALVGGTAASVQQSRKATKEQRKIRELEERKQAIARQRERRQAIAARQRAIASQESQAVAQGIQGSSGLFGATGAVTSQTASNLGFASLINNISNEQGAAAQSASDHQYKSQLWGGLANLSAQAGMAVLSAGTAPKAPTTPTVPSMSGKTNSAGIPVSIARFPNA